MTRFRAGLLNLISNAFYAVNERKLNVGEVSNLADVGAYQPTVTVSTQQMGNQIIIKVKDNGTGMPESVHAKVFQPFFTTKPTGSGTGLGLSMSYDIVTKGHGGTLEVVSTEGVGDMENIRLAMNRGAFDFICKSVQFEDLELTLLKTLKYVDQIRETIKAIIF